ncbi:MAG: RNA 2',3'-cyclic phosphodiesterase [Candidatus Omnitrophota bacterium]|nr:MAG: RNA 2',3'-cyclic phosphodiesterase [Candidatus Omnitrophota bacterium]
MRAFIAIDLPQDIKEALKAKEAVLKKCDLAVKWVEAKNIHLTLKFLGDIKEDAVTPIKETIKKVASEFSPVRVSLLNFGFFPNEKRPRVFFVATDKEDVLKPIASKLEERLEEFGFKKEGRFKSHITLGRFKDYRNMDCLKKQIKNTSLGEEFLIEGISFFKSTLTNSGPVYEKIAKIPLTK